MSFQPNSIIFIQQLFLCQPTPSIISCDCKCRLFPFSTPFLDLRGSDMETLTWKPPETWNNFLKVFLRDAPVWFCQFLQRQYDHKVTSAEELSNSLYARFSWNSSSDDKLITRGLYEWWWGLVDMQSLPCYKV